MQRSVTAIAMLLPLLGGCASLKHGPTERIAIDTNPGGADASIVCSDRVVASGVTPTSLAIPRRVEPCAVVLSKEGYESARVTLERGFSRYYWGNVGMAAAFPLALVLGLTVLSSGQDEVLAVGGVGLLGGGVGMIVDRVNGSMYDHDPAHVSVPLQLKAARNDHIDPEVVSPQTSKDHH